MDYKVYTTYKARRSLHEAGHDQTRLESEQDGVVCDAVGRKPVQAGVDPVAVVDHLLQVVDVVDGPLKDANLADPLASLETNFECYSLLALKPV